MNNGQPSRGGKWLALKELEKKSAKCSQLNGRGEESQQLCVGTLAPRLQAHGGLRQPLLAGGPRGWAGSLWTGVGTDSGCLFLGNTEPAAFSPGVPVGTYTLGCRALPSKTRDPWKCVWNPPGTSATGSPSSAEAFCSHLTASQVVLPIKNPPANAGDLRDVGSIPGWGGSPGGGNGNPLQCSYLENPMDRGAWQTAVHGVAKSRTRQKWLNTLCE